MKVSFTLSVGSATQIERTVRHLDRAGEATVDRVVFQQMRVGFDRPRGIDRHHLNVVATRFRDMGQRAAPDAAEAVDPDGDGHACRLPMP